MQTKRGLELGRPFGCPLLVHRSWFPAGALLAAHLTITVFGPDHVIVAMILGIVTAALVFGSVLVHELAHLAVRRMSGVGTSDVTLFLFGGIARTGEPRRAAPRLTSALAGPIASAAIGVVLLLAASAVSGTIGALILTVAIANLVLAGVNLLPVEPFDGARLLAALSLIVTNKPTGGARFAARGGQIVGAASVLGGAWLGVMRFPDPTQTAAGIWLAVVGVFVFSEAARAQRARTIADRVEGDTAGGWARPFTGRVRAETEVPSGGGPYAVSEGGRLAGILLPESIEANPGKRVRDVMIPWTPNIALPADAPLPVALERLASSGAGALVVLDDGGVVRGVLDEASVRTRLGAD